MYRHKPGGQVSRWEERAHPRYGPGRWAGPGRWSVTGRYEPVRSVPVRSGPVQTDRADDQSPSLCLVKPEVAWTWATPPSVLVKEGEPALLQAGRTGSDNVTAIPGRSKSGPWRSLTVLGSSGGAVIVRRRQTRTNGHVPPAAHPPAHRDTPGGPDGTRPSCSRNPRAGDAHSDRTRKGLG